MTAISLPPPDALQSVDFDALLAQLKADILAEMPGEQATIDLEADPLNEILQSFAYRIAVERNRANGQALSIMLPVARGPQLDQLGKLPFFNVTRKVLVAADPLAFPPVNEVLEDDDTFKERLRLSLNGLSVAGPSNAYRFHGISAHPSVVDISVDRPKFVRDNTAYAGLPADAIVIVPTYHAELSEPRPNDIAITVMTSAPNGEASPEVIGAVTAALNAEDVRPVSDNPRVRSVETLGVDIQATLYLYEGNEQDQVLAAAQERLTTNLDKLRRIGNDLTISAIHSGLHVDGVQRVEIQQPAVDTVVAAHQAFSFTIALAYGGVDQ